MRNCSLEPGARQAFASTRRCARRWSTWTRYLAPAGEMTVVLGPGWPGVLLHEAIGHGLEGDFNRKKTSSLLRPDGRARGLARGHRDRRRHPAGPARQR
jgi:predicted Zn-dependent protease